MGGRYSAAFNPYGERLSLGHHTSGMCPWVNRVPTPAAECHPPRGLTHSCACTSHACVWPCLPAVEATDVLHIAKNDCLLAGHGCWCSGSTVQLLYVVALEELKLTHEGLL